MSKYDDDGIKRGPILSYFKKYGKTFKTKKDQIKFESIDKMFRCVLFHIKDSFVIKNFDDFNLENERVVFSDFNIFIWCLFFDRFELSRIFWKRGKVCIL